MEPGMQEGCDTGPVWAPCLWASARHTSLGVHPSQVALWVSWCVSSLDKLKAQWDTPAPFLFVFWASPLLHFFPSNVIVRLAPVHYFRSFLFSRPFPWLHLAKASLTYSLWHLMFLYRQVKRNTFENSSSHATRSYELVSIYIYILENHTSCKQVVNVSLHFLTARC